MKYDVEYWTNQYDFALITPGTPAEEVTVDAPKGAGEDEIHEAVDKAVDAWAGSEIIIKSFEEADG